MSTPDILHSAIRQYRHNNSDGLVMGFDADKTEKVVATLQQEIESLRSDLERERAKIDIDLVNDPKAWKMLSDAMESRDKMQDERDELKQRVEGVMAELAKHNAKQYQRFLRDWDVV